MPVPDFSPGEILTAGAMDSIGLWLVKTQTIGAGVSSVTVTDAFSAQFDNYKIVISGVVLSGAGNSWFVKMANATGTSSKYVGDFMDYSSTSKFTLASTASASGIWVGLTGGTCSASFDLTDPFNAKVKNLFGQCANNNYGSEFRGVDTNAVSSSGFTLTQASTNMTGGTIRVYGYRN